MTERATCLRHGDCVQDGADVWHSPSTGGKPQRFGSDIAGDVGEVLYWSGSGYPEP